MKSEQNIKNIQWDAYRQLEQLPESAPNPLNTPLPSTLGLGLFWKKLLGLLMDELVAEQRVEYLDRCWQLNSEGDKSLSSPLKQFWVLIN